MPSREAALARAAAYFDRGDFRSLLAGLIAIPSTSQEAERAEALQHYLSAALAPWLTRLGFTVAIHPNPVAGFGPILTAFRREDPSRPTVLLYGHGDTVRGLDEQWRPGLEPWRLVAEGDRWYGRGSADNKGQHALNLAALEAVLAERGGRLGFNLIVLIETAEERGSRGLDAFVAAHAKDLAADVLIASDGPRVAPAIPTIATGTRGSFHFDLVLRLRPGGVHSGHWGGLLRDPAILLAHALTTLMDRHGRVLIRDLLPPALPPTIRAALADCPVETGEEGPTIDAEWGEPGLSPAEKIYGWNSLIVLAMIAGRPDNPVNAVAPEARAHCQIRYTVDSDPSAFVPALRQRLDEMGLSEVKIENAGVRMAASRTDPAHPWVRWAAQSIASTLGKPVQIIPNASGGLPGDVFVRHLGLPLVWVPHSYNGCGQHGPNEHLLVGPAREGILAFTGLWWDLGQEGTP